MRITKDDVGRDVVLRSGNCIQITSFTDKAYYSDGCNRHPNGRWIVGAESNIDVVAFSNSEPDMINSPSHYQTPTGLEAADVLDAFFPDNPRLHHAGKYLLRAGKKGPTEIDLKKCMWWIKRELEKKD